MSSARAGKGKRVLRLLHDTYERYDSRHGDLLAAAFSFYSLMSVAPLAVIVVTVAGLVVEPEAARAALLRGVEQASGREVADVVVTGLQAAHAQGGGLGAWIALALLLWAASKLFTVLQEALNALWGVQPAPSHGTWEAIRRVAAKRLLSFVMVIGCGALLIGSLIAQTVITSVRSSVVDALGLAHLQSGLALVQQLALSWALLSIAFATIFWLLPDARVRWRDVWIGAVTTAALVLAGTALLSLYLARIAPQWLQGAAGSIAAFVLWAYYLAQVFLLGASLTRVRATFDGHALEPEAHAMLTP